MTLLREEYRGIFKYGIRFKNGCHQLVSYCPMEDDTWKEDEIILEGHFEECDQKLDEIMYTYQFTNC